MSGRYRQRGSEDENTLVEGDAAFVGVDMRTDPASLEAGICAQAVNREFTQGVAKTRAGLQTLAWASEQGVSFDLNDPWNFNESLALGTIFGATVFADPFGQERMVVACEGICYLIAAGAPLTTLSYPEGLALSAPVTFTQAFNVLIMWRGEFLNPLKLETGLDFTEPQTWEEVPDETDEDYTSTIPDADRALHYGNRVWVGYDGSKVAFSDLLAYTRYDATLSTLYVNEGGSDKLQVLFPFGENAILAFKGLSIYAITDVLPSPGATARVQAITNQRGTIAPESVTQVGKDCFFLSDDGVYAISQALENSLQAATEPLSAALDPFFKRVNWAAATMAQGIYHDAKYFLALPIDGATYNNVIAVYDFLNGRWAGWWESAWLDAFKLLRMTVGGKRRLFVVSGANLDSENNGAIYMLGDGYQDERFGVDTDIPTELVTRGYTMGITDGKLFKSAEVEVATWYAAGRIEAVRDGVNEESAGLSFTKDRTKYNIFGKADFDPMNPNHDFLAPYRQDYSVAIEAGGVDFSGGVAVGLHQLTSERMRIRETGRHVQMRIVGTRGRVNVRAVAVAARATVESHRSKV